MKKHRGCPASAFPPPPRLGRSGSFQAGAGWAVMADDGIGKLRTEQGDGDGDGGSGGAPPETAAASSGSWLWGSWFDMLFILTLVIVTLLAYQVYRRWGKRIGAGGAAQQSQAHSLPRMKRRDFTLEQLREYDGARLPRILLAVNGKVFDVTKGSKFYGPGEGRKEGCRFSS